MAKKKKSQRRRNFAYSSSAKPTVTSAPIKQSSQSPQAAKNLPADSVSVEGNDPNYLSQDLKMIAILAVSAVALEVLLWILLRHTGLGHVFQL